MYILCYNLVFLYNDKISNLSDHAIAEVVVTSFSPHGSGLIPCKARWI
jgi:hypothetical protein